MQFLVPAAKLSCGSPLVPLASWHRFNLVGDAAGRSRVGISSWRQWPPAVWHRRPVLGRVGFSSPVRRGIPTAMFRSQCGRAVLWETGAR